MASDHVVTMDVEFHSATGVRVSLRCGFELSQTLRSCVEDFVAKTQLRGEPVLRPEDALFIACGTPWRDDATRLDKTLAQLQFLPDNGISLPYVLQLSRK